jgi:hypothetical protein
MSKQLDRISATLVVNIATFGSASQEYRLNTRPIFYFVAAKAELIIITDTKTFSQTSAPAPDHGRFFLLSTRLVSTVITGRSPAKLTTNSCVPTPRECWPSLELTASKSKAERTVHVFVPGLHRTFSVSGR